MDTLVDTLSNPIPTESKRVAAYAERARLHDWTKRDTEDVVIPPLDAEALTRQYGMDRATWPQPKYGTFRVPVGATEAQYLALRARAIGTFVEQHDKMGWTFQPQFKIQVAPGVYPAYDLRDRIPLLDQREFIVRACFCFRNPKPIRIELRPDDLEPYVLKKAAA